MTAVSLLPGDLGALLLLFARKHASASETCSTDSFVSPFVEVIEQPMSTMQRAYK
jgi:hypothetical protein